MFWDCILRAVASRGVCVWGGGGASPPIIFASGPVGKLLRYCSANRKSAFSKLRTKALDKAINFGFKIANGLCGLMPKPSKCISSNSNRVFLSKIDGRLKCETHVSRLTHHHINSS